jgi:glutamate N-acetyltransferase/amino-acid N-acetyltransferase
MKTELLATGGVTYARGFRASGMHCGIKRRNLDLALLVSNPPATPAGVFTQNQCCAAPVALSRSHIHADHIHAILINAGVANAATGEEGYRAAVYCAEETAYRLKCTPDEILVASTGVIGPQLPTNKIVGALDKLIAQASVEGATDAAKAIMTTDKVMKQRACEIELSDGTVRLGGMAKGSGMIMPNMATMLAFLTTDLACERHQLQHLLSAAVNASFNRITIDGDTSTNDCVFLLANGASNVTLAARDEQRFYAALEQLCLALAHAIVRDGEGATKFIAVRVEGCADERDADAIARTIANSPLVKTAAHGGDPNWGRILAAAGRAGVSFDCNAIEIHLNGVCTFANGTVAAFDRDALAATCRAPEQEIKLVLQGGDAAATVWTSDLSHGYIDINVAYS